MSWRCRPAVLRRHALFGNYKAADARHLPWSHVVTTIRVMTMTDPVATLVAQAQWADKLTDHHAGATVRLGNNEAALVEYLSGRWDSFMSAEFRPASHPTACDSGTRHSRPGTGA